MIRDIKPRINADKRDKITTGIKVDNKYPKSTDYFVIDAFEELKGIYGNKPQKLLISFPTDTIEDFFDCNYVYYAKKDGKTGSKIRQCDGETCTHLKSETFGGNKYEEGEQSPCICKLLDAEEDSWTDEDAKRRCKYVAYFKAYILNPQTNAVHFPICYMFETHSKNSGDNIYSELLRIKTINGGRLLNVRFVLSVDMVKSSKASGQTFPIWSMQVQGVLTEMKQLTAQGESKTLVEAVAEIAEEVTDEKLDYDMYFKTASTHRLLAALYRKLTPEQQKEAGSFASEASKRITDIHTKTLKAVKSRELYSKILAVNSKTQIDKIQSIDDDLGAIADLTDRALLIAELEWACEKNKINYAIQTEVK
jgi:hypothetical protein